MGNQPAKTRRKTEAEKVDAYQQQQTVQQSTHDNLSAARANIVQAAESCAEAGVLSAATTQRAAQLLQVTLIADQQLNRGGQEFTKADLIAIVLALEPQLVAHTNEISSLSCIDLRCKIRSVVFDPLRFMEKKEVAVEIPVSRIETVDHVTELDPIEEKPKQGMAEDNLTRGVVAVLPPQAVKKPKRVTFQADMEKTPVTQALSLLYHK